MNKSTMIVVFMSIILCGCADTRLLTKSSRITQATPTDGLTPLQRIVEGYIKEKTPQNVDLSVGKELGSNLIKKEANTFTVEKEKLKQVLEVIFKRESENKLQNFVSDIIQEIETTKQRFLIKEVSDGVKGTFTEDGYDQYIQVFFAYLPEDTPTKVSISLKVSHREGKFYPVEKTVTENICKKKFFGMYESCINTEKTIQVKREVSTELLQKSKDYVKYLLLKDFSQESNIYTGSA